MRSFVKIKSSRNGKIVLSFTDIGKSCPSREFLVSQICLLILAKNSGFTVLHDILKFFILFLGQLFFNFTRG